MTNDPSDDPQPNQSPTDLNSTGTLTIVENAALQTLVGEFNATDPEGGALTYHLVSGQGDGSNSLFLLDTNGTLKTESTFDYESGTTSYSIRVQAKDDQNATIESVFTVILTNDPSDDPQPNQAPTDLNSTGTLTMVENAALQTVVGEFSATDPEGGTLSYYLVSGTGDGSNSLFLLDTNGTLKTEATFDYESNASTYSIRVQAKDDQNASVESVFTITLTDDVSDNIEASFFVSGGQNGAPYYLFEDANGNVPDFTTLQLVKGKNYEFVAAGVSGSHPFMIGESYGNTSSSHVIGGPLNSSNDGSKIILSIPSDYSGNFYYYCQAHSGMSHQFQLSN